MIPDPRRERHAVSSEFDVSKASYRIWSGVPACGEGKSLIIIADREEVPPFDVHHITGTLRYVRSTEEDEFCASKLPISARFGLVRINVPAICFHKVDKAIYLGGEEPTIFYPNPFLVAHAITMPRHVFG